MYSERKELDIERDDLFFSELLVMLICVEAIGIGCETIGI
jgi:hypothetical protein